MNLYIRKFRPQPGRPYRKVHDERALALRTLAEFTIALLDFPWGWDTHSETYAESEDGRQAQLELERLAGRCSELGVGPMALSAWLDIAPTAVPLLSVLRQYARDRD